MPDMKSRTLLTITALIAVGAIGLDLYFIARRETPALGFARMSTFGAYLIFYFTITAWRRQ